jgi:hypothetical protein
MCSGKYSTIVIEDARRHNFNNKYLSMDLGLIITITAFVISKNVTTLHNL